MLLCCVICSLLLLFSRRKGVVTSDKLKFFLKAALYKTSPDNKSPLLVKVLHVCMRVEEILKSPAKYQGIGCILIWYYY